MMRINSEKCKIKHVGHTTIPRESTGSTELVATKEENNENNARHQCQALGQLRLEELLKWSGKKSAD